MDEMIGVNKKSEEQSELISYLEEAGGFDIKPIDGTIDFENKSGFTKLSLSSEQRIRVNALLGCLPAMDAAKTMKNAYVVTFPDGLQHSLSRLRNGKGYFGSVQGEKGRFSMTAILNPLEQQAIALGVFSAMSIASGQYFLNEINNELKKIRSNLDQILEFLYGDKKAELMAEASFVRYAYQNYDSIMLNDEQRIATIASLQETKKIAMKDVEFYIRDLETTVNAKENADIVPMTQKALQIKESLDFSIQLYGMTSVLEAYYAQNFSPAYIQYIEKDISIYVDKCDKRMLSSFSSLNALVVNYKQKPWEKLDKSPLEKTISDIIELYNSGEESAVRRSLCNALRKPMKKKEFYIADDGNIYIRSA